MEKQFRKQKGERDRDREEGRELFGNFKYRIHRVGRPFFQALSLLIFLSLCTFYLVVNTDTVMDLCLEILRFTILDMSQIPFRSADEPDFVV